MSVDATAFASAVWIAVAAPVEIFGTLIESVPGGRSRFVTRFAVGRPARASST